MLLTITNIPLTLRPQRWVGLAELQHMTPQKKREEEGAPESCPPGRSSTSRLLPPKQVLNFPAPASQAGPHLPGSHTLQPMLPLVAEPQLWSPSRPLSISCPQFSQTPRLSIPPPGIYRRTSHLHPTTPCPHSEPSLPPLPARLPSKPPLPSGGPRSHLMPRAPCSASNESGSRAGCARLPHAAGRQPFRLHLLPVLTAPLDSHHLELL